jgi:hypothetical protein
MVRRGQRTQERGAYLHGNRSHRTNEQIEWIRQRILEFQLQRTPVANGVVPSLHFWSKRGKMQCTTNSKS